MLFRRLHLQLTGLCALITIAILTVFTVLYLTVAEHNMKENLALTFQSQFDSLSGSLEQQTVLTYQYLLRIEQNNDCLIFLWDNGTPLSFNALESHAPYASLAASLYEDYRTQAKSDALTIANVSRFTSSKQSFRDSSGKLRRAEIYTGMSSIFADGLSASQKALALREGQGLTLLALSPNSTLQKRLERQRLSFALLSLAGCLLLTFFSYLFTGRLLRPLQENHEKQLAFIAGASHELRTPLAVILSAVEARPPQFETTVKAETLRMGRLVDEMLLLSRLDRQNAASASRSRLPHENTAPLDNVSLHFTTFPPDTFLLDFYEQMESYVRSEGRNLSLSLSDEVFPALYADADKLRQLLEILLQNALSYTEINGHIRLQLSLDRRNRQINFWVIDDGIGIPDEEKDKIFERFYRIESAHSSKEHFGLGLCIAREITEAHRGRIIVSDTPGGGCTFRCSFPYPLT